MAEKFKFFKFWIKIQEVMSILGAKIQTYLHVIYVCWTYQVILDNYQKDLISEAMVLWLLFCGLTCNEKWICYKKLFFLTSQPFVKNYFFAATNSVRKLLGNAFQFGSSNKATANKLQFFLSCYSNKAGKYFLVNHVPICWALKSTACDTLFESHWCILHLLTW